MGWPKGKPRPAGAGRKKGTTNKIPRDLREYIISVADQLEEQGKGLLQWASQNPNDYWGKVFKGVVPSNLNVNHSLEVQLRTLTDDQLLAKYNDATRDLQALEASLRIANPYSPGSDQEEGTEEDCNLLS